MNGEKNLIQEVMFYSGTAGLDMFYGDYSGF